MIPKLNLFTGSVSVCFRLVHGTSVRREGRLPLVCESEHGSREARESKAAAGGSQPDQLQPDRIPSTKRLVSDHLNVLIRQSYSDRLSDQTIHTCARTRHMLQHGYGRTNLLLTIYNQARTCVCFDAIDWSITSRLCFRENLVST